ncbi:Calnexin [Komagataella phaffii CBS 7435]|uniref:Calnexin n=2 Tax=Komagataella phaffii TaxID=460519 RepID=C4R0B4_KOMPG|nr:Calnexin [Komagataella phaffii GS115]AOA62936.1 GQ67_00360T0 [Komagataella phaffii]CAH2448556.1 Calnexin [Komagataella phaffii CBS 7435]AOA67353.1 GQ68_01029T0 [Komagataella phaffii GS115]CAY68938.1 Calnexin [Komagataella phaffii GS115]CCA38660.1 Calnexin [Komagataella phaffii CBS 7435]
MKISTIASSTLFAVGALAESEPAEFRPLEAQLDKSSFFEQFDKEPKLGDTWKISHAVKNEEFTYVGEWAIEEPVVYPGFKKDRGLVVKSEAAHHAISAQLPQVFDNTDNTLVLQYEVKLQQGLNCGGAYVKLLSAEGLNKNEFSNETPYQVMFGPDKCGTTNKVHLIIKRKNPATGEYEEHQLATPPMGRIVKTTSLYTLIIKPNNDFEIRINGEVAKAGNLLNEKLIKPPFGAPKEIDDPEDQKPEDWVDEDMIPDPDAVKPEDWDESEPLRIVDPEAVKPENWNEDAELYIPDPEATKPEDWDDEEDGEWVAPVIPNPECADIGCGPWKAPYITNPNYKGKWSPPLIENPDYKGPWSPKKIANPNYFEDKKPANLEPIGGLGFELWTMNADILFDNIYLGHSIKEAEFIGNETFVPKLELEEAESAKNAPKPDFEPETPPETGLDSTGNIFTDVFDTVFQTVLEYYVSANAFLNDVVQEPSVLLERPGEAVYYLVTFFSGFTFLVAVWSGLIFALTGAGKKPETSAKTPTKSTQKIEEVTEDETEKTDSSSAAKNSTKATKRT